MTLNTMKVHLPVQTNNLKIKIKMSGGGPQPGCLISWGPGPSICAYLIKRLTMFIFF
ncbi:UNVERIFIED_CONTAM: hypothetical protein FKN15_000720 [Acipenser sinensis]